MNKHWHFSLTKISLNNHKGPALFLFPAKLPPILCFPASCRGGLYRVLPGHLPVLPQPHHLLDTQPKVSRDRRRPVQQGNKRRLPVLSVAEFDAESVFEDKRVNKKLGRTKIVRSIDSSEPLATDFLISCRLFIIEAK